MKGIKPQDNNLKELEEYPFVTKNIIKNTKPGDPLSYVNLYVANCNPNALITSAAEIDIINKIANILFLEKIINEEEYLYYQKLNLSTIASFIDYIRSLPKESMDKAILIADEILYNPYSGSVISGPSNPKGCAIVEYKPNNPQFAKQGSVSSSTRTLKLNVTTIEKNVASIRGANVVSSITNGERPYNPFIYKNKVPKCNPGIYTKDGNPKTCFKNTNDSSFSDYNPVAVLGNVTNQLSDMTSIVNH